MAISTADLCDKHIDIIQVANPIFQDFGQVKSFSGKIVTIECFEDNSLVKSTLNEAGENQVLVVDGGASLRCALLGDGLAEAAVRNNWAGIIINGCVRDSGIIAALELGVKAIFTSPVRSVKKNTGKRNNKLHFAGITFIPCEFVYADKDGVIVSPKPLY